MPIVTNNPSSLKLKYNCGNDSQTGKMIVKSKTYSNVSPDAVDDDIYAVGTTIASLQKNTVLEVARIDNSTLSN